MKFASAQLEALEVVIKALNKKPQYSKTTKHLEILLDKLQKLNTPKAKQKPGIGVNRAIEAMRSVLGDKLAVPRNPAETWTIYLSQRIRNLGLTEEDCKKIARCVAIKWNPPYGFEFCIKAADRLLVEAETLKERPVKTVQRAPVEMDDEWA